MGDECGKGRGYAGVTRRGASSTAQIMRRLLHQVDRCGTFKVNRGTRVYVKFLTSMSTYLNRYSIAYPSTTLEQFRIWMVDTNPINENILFKINEDGILPLFFII